MFSPARRTANFETPLVFLVDTKALLYCRFRRFLGDSARRHGVVLQEYQ
jgi:hypothetical protein